MAQFRPLPRDSVFFEQFRKEKPMDPKLYQQESPPFSEYVAEAKAALIELANRKSPAALSGCTSFVSRTLPCSYEMAEAIMNDLEQSGFITTQDGRGFRRLIPPQS